MSRRSGGFRGAKPTWTTTSTSGIFGMEDVVDLKAAGQWPRGPVAPTSLAGTVGDQQVALTWVAPATTHGTITDYVVEYTPAAGSPTVVATGSTAASYTLTGLTNDTEYTFRVAAVNHTRGDWSSSVAVTPSSGPPSGQLFGWGYNAFGQLGNGTNTGDTANSSQGTPLQSGSATWVSVAAFQDHSLGIAPDGTLWAWGANGSGQLGVGDKTDRNTPTQVGNASDWASVSTGESHTLAVKTNGTLWGWGHSGSGRLADATSTDRTSPQQIGSATDWSQVACGGAHSLVLKTDNTLWAFGDNWYGQVGNGSSGSPQTSPYQISGLWSSVDAGFEHSMGIKNDGSLWGWGYGLNERLGTGDYTNRNTPTASLSGSWTSVKCDKGSSGGGHTVAIRDDQTLWTFGRNSAGQLGNGGTWQNESPSQVAGSWANVVAGRQHTIGIKTDGTLWAWGEAFAYNQVGDGQNTDRTSPVQIGSATTWLSVAGGRGHSLGIKA